MDDSRNHTSNPLITEEAVLQWLWLRKVLVTKHERPVEQLLRITFDLLGASITADIDVMAYWNTDRNLALIYRFLYDPVMWLVGRNTPIDLHNFSELTGKVRLRSNLQNAQKPSTGHLDTCLASEIWWKIFSRTLWSTSWAKSRLRRRFVGRDGEVLH